MLLVQPSHSFWIQWKPTGSTHAAIGTPTTKAATASAAAAVAVKRQVPPCQMVSLEYDIVVIGAGASGMFAAGTSSSLGRKTLLIDKHNLEDTTENDFYLGGDCTNAACVPSKAVRCAARVAALSQRAFECMSSSSSQQRQRVVGSRSAAAGVDEVSSVSSSSSSSSSVPFLASSSSSSSSLARQYSRETTNKVRQRESPDRIVASVPNLHIMYTAGVSFVQSKSISVQDPYLFNGTFSDFLLQDTDHDDDYDDDNDVAAAEKKTLQISAKKFILCTGAGPSVPEKLAKSAKKIGLPLLTYRSIFRPDGEGKQSDFLWNMDTDASVMSMSTDQKKKKKRVVIVGGGGTACEIAQCLARLNKNIQITIVAPTILDKEDIAARAVARKILMQDGVNIISGRRVVDASRMGQISVLELDDETQLPVDVLICATGRSPGRDLEELQLDQAGVKWTPQDGILVNQNLRSVSCKHVFAAGDCTSAVPKLDRRASHAAWMGYHAVLAAVFPKFLLASDAIHPHVPRVTFTDPEIASIGKSRADCVREYGANGFRYLKVHENGTDRADIDSMEGRVEGFVELRISKPDGRILGATVCSPVASEIVNEIGVALVNKLTVGDIARSIHAYPSHGYLMHRVALSLALSDQWGVLDAMGPIARYIRKWGTRFQAKLYHRRPRKSTLRYREWEGTGEERELQWERKMSSVSYLEASTDKDFCDVVRRHMNDETIGEHEKQVLQDFISWLDSKPSR